MANLAGLNMKTWLNWWLARYHNIGCRRARTIFEKSPCRFSFFLQVDARQCPTPRSGSWPRSFQGHIKTVLREGSKSCVPLAIPPDVSHISRPEWIRRFEIAQKRLLASWSDLLDLSDLPEVGSQAFVAAFTEEQRIHYQQLNTDEEKLNTKRPFENRLLQIERPNIRLNFRCRIVLDFLGTIRPQRTTARALCFINEYSSNRNASIYLSPSETAFLRAFLRFANRCCRPKYRTPKTVDLLHHRQRRDRRRWTRILGHWRRDRRRRIHRSVYRDRILGSRRYKGSYSKRRLYGRSFKKGKPKGYGKKGKRSRPGFRPRSKGHAAWDNDQQNTAFWGKGKGKKGKKGMTGKDSFKGMPSWKGKGKGDGKNKGGKPYQQQQPPQANVAQQASSSASQAPEKAEVAQAEESWSYDYDTYWTNDWSTYDSYNGYDGDYSQSDWYNWSYYASIEELTLAEDKHSEDFDHTPEDGQTDQNNRFCFSAVCLFRYLGRELMSIMSLMFLFVSLLYQCFSGLNRNSFLLSIRFVEESIATDTGDMHPYEQHTCPLQSDSTEECVYLNCDDHGAQQALLFVSTWI